MDKVEAKTIAITEFIENFPDCIAVACGGDVEPADDACDSCVDGNSDFNKFL